MRRRWSYALGVAAGIAVLSACESPEPGTVTVGGGGCASDVDCKGDRICVDGECVAAPDSNEPSGDGGGTSAGSGGSSGVLVGGSSAPPADAGSSADDSEVVVRATGDLIEVALSAEALLADEGRGVIYATVGGAASAYANQLVTLDATSGEVVDAVAVGSEPTTMAMSDDGSTLWVSISGAYAVREIDLSGAAPVPGMQHGLPPGDFGDLAAARPMVVLPGTTDSLAVSLHYFGLSPSFAGLVVLDDGVERMNRTDGHTGASRLTGGPAGYLFGFNNLHTGFGFYGITVDAAGVTQTEHPSLVGGFETDIAYAGDYVYASSGEVVDVSDPAVPVRAGTFAAQGPVVPRPDGKTAVMLSIEGTFDGPLALRVLDVETFTATAVFDLSSSVTFRSVHDLVRAAPDTYAFIGSDDPFGGTGSVYLVRVPELAQ